MGSDVLFDGNKDPSNSHKIPGSKTSVRPREADFNFFKTNLYGSPQGSLSTEAKSSCQTIDFSLLISMRKSLRSRL